MHQEDKGKNNKKETDSIAWMDQIKMKFKTRDEVDSSRFHYRNLIRQMLCDMPVTENK